MSKLKGALEKLEEGIDIEQALKSAVEQLEENKMHVYTPKNKNEVNDTIWNLVKSDDIIILDNAFELIEHGICDHAIENELNFACADPAGFLEYKDTKKVSISNKLKYSLKISKNELEDLVKYFKDYSNISTVGIVAPDFVASDLGSLFIVDDFWGRSVLCTTPRRNVFLIGIERIINNFFLASQIAFLKAKAISKDFNVQVHIVNFPSRTGDIEKIVVYGAHGPREVSVVFIDNGRLEILKNNKSYITLSILTQFIDIYYPELTYIANCMGIPTIDPLKLRIIASSGERFNPDNLAILLKLLASSIPKLNGVFWKDKLVEFYESIYREIEGEVSDIGAVQNRVQELENIINKIWGGA